MKHSLGKMGFEMKGVRLHGFFCDDIRQEVGGKTSLMGCYHTDILFKKFPAAIHQLCFLGRLVIPVDVNVEEDIFVTAFAGSGVLIKGVVPRTGVPELTEEEKKSENGVSVVTIELVISPLRIEEPCLISVSARIGDHEIRALPLRAAVGDPAKYSLPIIEAAGIP